MSRLKNSLFDIEAGDDESDGDFDPENFKENEEDEENHEEGEDIEDVEEDDGEDQREKDYKQQLEEDDNVADDEYDNQQYHNIEEDEAEEDGYDEGPDMETLIQRKKENDDEGERNRISFEIPNFYYHIIT